MRLLLAELLRFWSRRLVIIAVPIIILISAAIAVPAGVMTYPISGAEQAQAQAEYRGQLTEWANACPNPDQDQCGQFKPTPEDFGRTPMALTDAFDMALELKLNLINLLCLLIGTSFIAAEFRSGTMSTWLTFNPNRNRVYLAKLVATSLSTGLITALAAATAVLSLAITVSIAQVPFTLPNLWQLIGWNFLGGALLAAVAVSIGMITRHTVAGLGVAIGVNFLEGVAALLFMLVPALVSLGRFLPGNQLNALLTNGSIYYEMSFTETSFDEMAEPVQVFISAGEGALYWLLVAVGLTALGMFTFNRREVR